MKKISNKNIFIRKLKLSDFSEAVSLWEKAGLNLANIRVEFSEFQSMIRLDSSACFVLVFGGSIIGSVLGTFNGRRAWVYHLVIDPKYQSKGYGSILLETAEKELKQKGAHKINLSVLNTNLKVLPFYTKNGYSIMDDAIYLTKRI